MGPSASLVLIKPSPSVNSSWLSESFSTTLSMSKGWITALVIIVKLDASGGSTAQSMRWTAKTFESGPQQARETRTQSFQTRISGARK